MLVVYNPTAGRRRARLLWRVLDIAAESGVRLDIMETTHPGHARTLAREAAAGGAGLVVAAGGDGTIAEVANGLAGSACRLGIIPLGTANVLANELGLRFAPRAVAAALAFGRTRRIWPGVATSAAGERLFVQMLGAGFDAQVVRNLSLPLKRIIGRSAYAVQTLGEALRYRFPRVRLRLDGEAVEAVSVIVSKGRFYGGRFLLAPEARPGERGFHVALFDRPGVLPTLLSGAALTLDALPRSPWMRLCRAQEVCIDSIDVPLQSDGEAAGDTPVVVTDAAVPIDVLVG